MNFHQSRLQSKAFFVSGDENLLIFIDPIDLIDFSKFVLSRKCTSKKVVKWILFDFCPNSIFQPKGGGKLRTVDDFWCRGKRSYYVLTTVTFFRESESQ